MINLFKSRVNFDLLKYTFKKQTNLLLIFTLMLSITFPFVIIVQSIAFTNIASYDYINSMMLLLLIGSIFLLMSAPFIFFNYLTSKKSVDFMHALPIKRRDLMLTNALISYLYVVIPFAIAYWSGYILLYIFQGISFEMQHLSLFLQFLVLFIAVQLPSLFVIMNTGTTSDSVIYSFILFLVPFIAYGAYEVFASRYIMGVDSLAFSNFLNFSSPSAALFRIYINGDVLKVDGFLLVYWLVFSIVTFEFTSHLYDNWKSELSEHPFNNPIFFNFVSSIFIGLLLVFLLSVLTLNYDSKFRFLAIENLLIPLLASFVTYIILDSIRRRSFQGIKRSIKRYSVIALITLSSTVLIFVTQGFGFSNHIPDLDDINSVKISTNVGYSDHYMEYAIDQNYSITDESEIEEVIAIHQSLVDAFKKSNRLFNSQEYVSQLHDVSSQNYQSTVRLVYTLGNSNKEFVRSFSIPHAMYELVYPLFSIDSVQLKNQPLLDADRFISDFKIYDSVISESYDLSYELIRETLKSELLALDTESLLLGHTDLSYILVYRHMGEYYQINIDSRFPKTLELIRNQAINPLKTSFNHYLVDDIDYYGSADLMSKFSWFDPEGKKPLSHDELIGLKGRVFSTNFDIKKHNYLVVQIDNNHTSIPVK